MTRDHTIIEKQFIDIYKFYKTMRAIRSGYTLYTKDKKDIEDSPYLTPWKFNFLGVSIIFITSSILIFLFGLKDTRLSFDHINDTKDYKDLIKYLYALAIPLNITLSAYIYSIITLDRKSINKDNFNKNFNTYLYYDTAYSFIPNFLITLTSVYSTALIDIINSEITHIFKTSASLLGFFMAYRIIYVRVIDIPFRMIENHTKNFFTQLKIGALSTPILLLYMLITNYIIIWALPYWTNDVINYFYN